MFEDVADMRMTSLMVRRGCLRTRLEPGGPGPAAQVASRNPCARRYASTFSEKRAWAARVYFTVV